MSDLRSALPGASHEGEVSIREGGLRGMITLRGDLADARLRTACASVAGVDFPAQGGIVTSGPHGIGWMSPDEALVLVPHAGADAAVASLTQALAGQHHLAVNVSDARALFTLSGAGWPDVVARLSPTDLRGFGPGLLRRTRFGQVAAAIWQSGETEASVVCFRSVAGYMFDLLENAARSGRL